MNKEKPKYKKKLIEVAMPLDIINAVSAKEKSTRHGHPSTMHIWWARRTISASKAVIVTMPSVLSSTRPIIPATGPMAFATSFAP